MYLHRLCCSAGRDEEKKKIVVKRYKLSMLPLPRGLFGTVVVVRNKIVSVIAEKTQPGSQIARKLKNFGSAEDVELGKCVLLFLLLFSFNFQVREPGLYQVTCVVFSFFLFFFQSSMQICMRKSFQTSMCTTKN